MTKIPLIILNGALGSGKTTLVKRLLQHPAYAGSFLIENEYASVNIDREALLDEHDDEIYEISGSCICCSTGEELEEALDAVVARGWTKPVILEATGMANSGILLRRLFLNPRFMEHFQILSAVLMIDAGEADPAELGVNLELEVKLADLIVINKADLEPRKAKKLSETVQAVNPSASIVSAVQADIDLTLLQSQPSHTEIAFARVFPELGEIELDESTYAVLDLEGPLEPEKVRTALTPEAFGEGTSLRRAKGFFMDYKGVQWQVEATAKHVELRQLKSLKSPVIVAIGGGITKASLKEVLS